MSTPPPAPIPGANDPAPASPKAGQPFWSWLRNLGITRSSDRWIGGVAGGIAARWGVDPLIVRGLFVATMVLGGVGFLLYAAAWALLPEPDGRIHAEQALTGNVDSAVIGIVALAIAGIGPATWIGPASWIGNGDGAGWSFGWIAVLSLAAWIAYRRGVFGGKGSSSTTTTTPPPPPGAAGATPWGTAPTSPAPSSDDLTGVYPAAAHPAHPGHQSYSAYSDAPVTPDPLETAEAARREAEAKAHERAQRARTKAEAKAREKADAKASSPGAATVAIVSALALLTVAGLLLAGRSGLIEGAGWALAIGIVLVLVGAGIVVSGLRGRSSGTLGFFAIVGLILAPSAFANASGWDWSWEGSQTFGDSSLTPTTRDDAADGVRIGAGNAELDLTQVPLTGDTLIVPVNVGAGEITVVVPAGVDVQADVDIFAGEVTWDVGGDREVASGRIPGDLTYTTTPEGETPQLLLDLRIGAGDVTIQEATS